MVNCPYATKKSKNALNEISSGLACEYDFICDGMSDYVKKQPCLVSAEYKKKGHAAPKFDD